MKNLQSRKIADEFGVKPSDKANGDTSFVVKCCCHEDQRESLSLTVKANGSLLINCFAGCSATSVYNELKRRGLLVTRSKEDYIQKIIAESQRIENKSPQDNYIQSRGLVSVEEENLRSTKIWHNESGRMMNALLCIVRNENGFPTGVQSIFLDESGSKVKVGTPKKCLGVIAGSSVVLGEIEHKELHLTEGVENGLAIRQVVGGRVLAVLSAVNLSNQKIQSDVTKVHFWGDLDKSKTGQREVLKAFKKLSTEFPEAEFFLHFPKKIEAAKNTDWLDVLNLKDGIDLIHEEYITAEAATIEDAEELILDIPIIPSKKEIETPSFPIDSLPELLRNFCTDVCERLGVPIEAVLIPLIAVISSLIGNKVCIFPKVFDFHYKIYANLWGLLIGNPSTKKSPAMKVSISMLEDLQHSKLKELKDAIRLVRPKIEVAEKVKASILNSIKKEGANDEQMKSLYKVEEDLTNLKRQLQIPKYIINDATPEKVLELSQYSANGFMIFRDEASGLYNEFEKTGREGYRQLLLEGWTGSGYYAMDRKVAESNAARICFSIFGSIQPDLTKNFIKKSAESDDGFFQRNQLMIFIPESSVSEGVDRLPCDDYRAQLLKFLSSLFEAKEGDLGSKNGVDGSYGFRFSNEAYKLLKSFLSNLRKKSLAEESNLLKSHYNKYDKLICSLALIFHLSKGSSNAVIEIDTLQSAIEVVEFLMKHAEIIYKTLPSKMSNGGLKLLQKIKSGQIQNGASKRSIIRNGGTGLDRDGLDIAIEELTALNWLIVEKNNNYTGRPSDVLNFSPLLPKYIHLVI